MSHREPGFQRQQVQVQVPRLRPPATDQVLGVGTAWEPQPVYCLVLPTIQSVQYCIGNECINTSVVKQECFTKNNTMQSLLLQ